VTSNFVRTASHRLALDVVPTNNALKSTSYRNARNIYGFAVFEDISDRYFFTYLVPAKTLCVAPDLFDVTEGAAPCLFELAKFGLGAALVLLWLKTKLNRAVTVNIVATDIKNETGSSLNYGHWNALSFRCKHLGHSQLLP
jgi:hypothetical protein